jgi:drug/metabolite transporter (DMT)-like permease
LPSSAIALYLLTVFIWGSTWLGIKFQLGTVQPLVSVIYRFAIAGVLLFVWCALARAPLRISRRNHGFIALQGCTLFGINYWLVYWSEVYLTSGIVAVIFSSLVFLNIFNARLFLQRKVSGYGLLGACIGFAGVALLFYPEMRALDLNDHALRGFLFGFGATFVASLGSIVATRNSHSGLPVITVNAWGMFYGTLMLIIAALVSGAHFSYEYSTSYTLSLIYLALFGSVIAFGAYLRLLSIIGPEKAGYSSMVIPIVALAISTLYENYVWSILSIIGLALIISGNIFAMRR